ncbi:hypothetical protein [Streptomyces clavuligerus]|uniref:hypothetical protein n=1 Tax=Streptomyces clavuligerus TaxID=1901 RepID=UPI001F083284|nr:hypothetical protein [Streptomyces clavuligerus]
MLPGVDLRMEAQQDGFTQLLVVKVRAAAADKRLAELRLALAAEGLEVRQTAGGGLAAVDAEFRGHGVRGAPAGDVGLQRSSLRRRSARGPEADRPAPRAVPRGRSRARNPEPVSPASWHLWGWNSPPPVTR